MMTVRSNLFGYKKYYAKARPELELPAMIGFLNIKKYNPAIHSTAKAARVISNVSYE